MAIEIRDPDGREWRIWREWIEFRVHWGEERGPASRDLFGTLQLFDLGGGFADIPVVGAIFLLLAIALVVAICLAAVWDLFVLAVPILIAVAISVAGLIKRLLRLAPFSVEAQSAVDHTSFQAHGLRASRRAMKAIAASIAAGNGPRLDAEPGASRALH